MALALALTSEVIPLDIEVQRLQRHGRWLQHHIMELDAELGALITAYTTDLPGVREEMNTCHNECQNGFNRRELPDYGGKCGCSVITSAFSTTNLGKGRSCFYLECWWGRVLYRPLPQDDYAKRRLVWWTMRFAADWARVWPGHLYKIYFMFFSIFQSSLVFFF